MNEEFPNDSDGDALRRVARDGADMSQPMVIDFSVLVPNESSAHIVSKLVALHAFDPSIFRDDADGSWSVYCSRTMLATYEDVVRTQAELNSLLRPHAVFCDGWGTFGNKQQ